MKRLLVSLPILLLAVFGATSTAQAAHIWNVNLYALGGSGISASATLTEQTDGTVQVVLRASGLRSGVQYISGVYNRSSVACTGGLIRAQTDSGFSNTTQARKVASPSQLQGF